MRTPEPMTYRHTKGMFGRFRRDLRGATALEYGILMMMIAFALIGMSTLTNLAENQNAAYNKIADSLQ